MSIKDYPLILEAKDIMEILNISKPTCYEVMRQQDFPCFSIGKSKKVMRDDFFEWIKTQKQGA